MGRRCMRGLVYIVAWTTGPTPCPELPPSRSQGLGCAGLAWWGTCRATPQGVPLKHKSRSQGNVYEELCSEDGELSHPSFNELVWEGWNTIFGYDGENQMVRGRGLGRLFQMW